MKNVRSRLFAIIGSGAFACLLAALIFTSGCVRITEFQAIPTHQDDFQLSGTEIRSRYTDIQKYEGPRFYLDIETPLIEDLNDKWGRPDSVKKEWSYFGWMGLALAGVSAGLGAQPAEIIITAALVLLVRPHPPERQFWVKGNYCIEAHVDKTFDRRYKRRMTS